MLLLIHHVQEHKQWLQLAYWILLNLVTSIILIQFNNIVLLILWKSLSQRILNSLFDKSCFWEYNRWFYWAYWILLILIITLIPFDNNVLLILWKNKLLQRKLDSLFNKSCSWEYKLSISWVYCILWRWNGAPVNINMVKSKSIYNLKTFPFECLIFTILNKKKYV